MKLLIILLPVGTFLLLGYFFNPQGVCTTANTVVKDAMTQFDAIKSSITNKLVPHL
jgi:hypothetical protein